MNRPKGTKDNFDNNQVLRDYIEETINSVAILNNFSKIETPIFEKAEVFKRAVGETSDIVSKEMYSFTDRKGREMVLRPEGTAGVVRAIVENKLYAQSLPLKLFYYGPMFRYERPQKGRQRQFTQFGVEMLSDKSPYADAEVILLAHSILESLGIQTKLVINSLGNKETRDNYSKAVKKYLEVYKDQLTDDSINRLDKNPLRILDDKVDGEKDFVKNAPKISEFYSEDTKAYFETVQEFLTAMGISFEVNPVLVRGLDYYSDTAFEFISISGKSGSQSTIIGGGRYSNLVKQFGGPDLSGVGFAFGIERLMNEFNIDEVVEARKLNVEAYVMNLSEETTAPALGIAHMLRRAGYITEWNQKPMKLQKAFAAAEKVGTSAYIIAGAKELAKNKVNVKIDGEQETVDIDSLVEFLDGKLGV